MLFYVNANNAIKGKCIYMYLYSTTILWTADHLFLFFFNIAVIIHKKIDLVEFGTQGDLCCKTAYGPFQRHVCDQKKWKISFLNGYSSWYKHAINKFLIDNSASCSSQDIQVFEN